MRLVTARGSRFYENERKKEQQVNQRIEKMLQQKAQITEHQLKKRQNQVERLAIELEKSRDLSRTIIHIDMDAFYAAVEMKDTPELKDKPMAVGSMSMLSTSNYHARKYGVRAAMPGFIAKKLCPNLIIIPTNFDKYRAVSKEVQGILVDYDPNFLPMSLDEAYLDITEHLQERQNWPEHKRTYYCHREGDTKVKENMADLQPSTEDLEGNSPILFEDSPPVLSQQGSIHCEIQQTDPYLQSNEKESHEQQKERIVFGVTAEEAVREMRFRVEQKTKLTASSGIAPNMMLSKVCSDMNKPNGQYRIPADSDAVMGFIKNLPIRKVPGIGKVTEKMLNALGITTCTELYQQGALLSLLFSESSWYHFLQISLGLGETHLERDGDRKSMSTERTFSEISKAAEQYSLCRDLCRDLEEDLQKEGLRGKTVTLKLKNINFEVKTRACTVPSPISKEEEIFAVAYELLKTEINSVHPRPLRLRLMGVRMSGFTHQEEKKSHQKSIIKFFHTGKSESTTCTPTSDSIDVKNQTELPETFKRESLFNKKLQQNNQQSFFNQVLAKKQQERCNPAITIPSSTVDEMQLKGSDLTPELKATSNCPMCFKRQGAPTLEEFNKQVNVCLCVNRSLQVAETIDKPNISKTSYINTIKTSGLDNGLKNKKITNLKSDQLNNEQKGRRYKETPSEIYRNTAIGDLKEETENSSINWISSIKNSTCSIGQSGDEPQLKETLKSHMQLPNSAAKTLEITKDILEEEISDSNNLCNMLSGKSTHRTQEEKQFGQQESNASMLDPPSFAQLDQLIKKTCCMQQQSDQAINHTRSSQERPSFQLGEPTGLVCPICNIKQETTDLSLFNRHVDICLNQGVIQELTERPAQPVTTNCISNGIGLTGFGTQSSNSVRTKRTGSTAQQPTTKKARCDGSKNTIDRFFK
ncbi:DNA polymerase kappa isoform X2 [Heterodontus francisci]|uniref:DNA polymerase kappa isoform X2 n=1 Tax=Heterodontus francisci TaxID=7792 RepID=UPI00355B44A2